MKVRIVEGRLVETPTEDAAGLDRRAFGEFIGPHGELASYAFGWSTSEPPDHARMSVGIGAGNPGGGTFHIAIGLTQDGFGFALLDDPFEQGLPEGGPDLTAGQARAHEDLPFIWFIVEEVLAADRRAWWLRHWLAQTTALLTPQVFDQREPVLRISHRADDGEWDVVGSSDLHSDAVVGHLSHVIDEDPSLLDVLDLGPGETASRPTAGGQWTRTGRPHALTEPRGGGALGRVSRWLRGPRRS